MILPALFIRQALQGVHDDMGHPGRDRTMSVLRDRFWWPGMSSDSESWVRNCDRFIKRKSSTNIRAPMVSIVSNYPTELVCMDYLALEPSKGGIGNILVITDHLPDMRWQYRRKIRTAKTTVEAFFNNFVCTLWTTIDNPQ